MPNHKINILEKKVSFPLSIRRVVKDEFERKCEEMSINKNELAESLFCDYLNSLKHEDYDPTK